MKKILISKDSPTKCYIENLKRSYYSYVDDYEIFYNIEIIKDYYEITSKELKIYLILRISAIY